VGFVVDKMALGQVFSGYSLLGFRSFSQFLYSNAWLSQHRFLPNPFQFINGRNI
jgi:hypothetical protein